MRFFLGEQRRGDAHAGSCTVPWWTIGYLLDARHQGVRVGPVYITRFRFSRSDYAVHIGGLRPGWHWYVEWLGFKSRTTSWISEDCF